MATVPNPTTVMISTNSATAGTAQDIDRRTSRALPAVYMRMVMCGSTAAPSTTVSSEVIMSSSGLGPPANCSPELRNADPAPLLSAAVLKSPPRFQSNWFRMSTEMTAPEPSSITIFRIWMRAVPFMPPIAA
jgi:hypothetical protein